jgi:hypothetical protein
MKLHMVTICNLKTIESCLATLYQSNGAALRELVVLLANHGADALLP